jgi:hypothetical protein
MTARLQRRLGDGPLLVGADGTGLDAADCLGALHRRAGALVGRGVAAGERVAVLHPLSIDALILWWAIDHVGAVYVPLNPTWPPSMLRRARSARGSSTSSRRTPRSVRTRRSIDGGHVGLRGT